MAAIEKICEYSGDYPGWNMYGYKHNHIQICPQYRKQFKNARHVLVISKHSIQQMYPGGGTSTLDVGQPWFDDEYRHCTDNGLVMNRHWKGNGWYEWQGKRYSPWRRLKKIKTRTQYVYDLYCPDLPGEVGGHYINYSTDIATVKRKLKRMLGGKLAVVYIEGYATNACIRDVADGYTRAML